MGEHMAIDKGEWYPVYYSSESEYGLGCDVPDGFRERWQAAVDEFNACQEIMKAAYSAKESDKPEKPRLKGPFVTAEQLEPFMSGGGLERGPDGKLRPTQPEESA